jgi:hypothetical protein
MHYMPPGLRFVVFLWAALLFAQPAGKPTLRARAVDGARIAVDAADPVGLDTLTIDWPAADLRYDTGLSGSTRFQRSFAVREIFPGTAAQSMRLTLSVRNTQGATADTTIVVRPDAPPKGK